VGECRVLPRGRDRYTAPAIGRDRYTAPAIGRDRYTAPAVGIGKDRYTAPAIGRALTPYGLRDPILMIQHEQHLACASCWDV
jgi:hypothetical protein